MASAEDLEAFAFRELTAHLRMRTDVQNIDLMNLSGFCRNCLSKWYFLAAHRLGRAMTYDDAVLTVYGMTMAEWKKTHQRPATQEQLERFANKEGQAQIDVDTKVPAPGVAAPAQPAAAVQPAGGLSSACCRPTAELAGAAPIASTASAAGSAVAAAGSARAAVLTISDRASEGVYADLSGPLLARLCGAVLPVAASAVVPDSQQRIERQLRQWADEGVAGGRCGLVLTTGGTGLAPRDVTPEATAAVCERAVPGLAEAVRAVTSRVEPLAALSRATAGIRGGTLIVNLPGRPKAVEEAMTVLQPMLGHAVAEVTGRNAGTASHFAAPAAPAGPSDTALEAFAFRELTAHLRMRTDVQNIDLMNLSGFCRNCLSKWYFLAAHRLGRAMTYDDAVLTVYGMTMAEWKKTHQRPATQEQLERFANKEGQAQIDVDTKVPAPGVAAVRIVGRPRESQHLMMEMDEALACVAAEAPSQSGTTELPLSQCRGRVLAADARCPHAHPPFAASIKDGYAVRSADGAGVFKVAAAVTAGEDATALELQPATVCRVSTGGAVPRGADAVVQLEDTELVLADEAADKELTIRVLLPAKPGQDIRPAGCDIAAGSVVLAADSVLGAAEIGLLATAGLANVAVRSRPVVAVLSTGTELIPVEDQGGRQPSATGTIFDSNRPMLIAALQSDYFNCEVIDLGVAPDDADRLLAVLRDGMSRADVVITSGGVSMGERDLVKAALDSLGCKMHFGRVEMKPGKPTTFATAEVGGRRRCFFGLPGNPVSCLVCLHLFVRPALRKIQGFTGAALHARRVSGVVGGAADIKLDQERPEFHRCVLQWDDGAGGYVAHSTGKQASHRLLSARGAEAVMALPKGTPERPVVKAGERVGIVLLG
eukprot:TRINITY_DN10776_c0_g2_i2.p1 TRINITY_DN10776_c0_g2~~TRINITY_DN10776_c0_g2_i2.p1  ORF type:complete len:881 (+),score=343.79 TRINITY_DN10776_c0_g2_i2:74-2716(+)